MTGHLDFVLQGTNVAQWRRRSANLHLGMIAATAGTTSSASTGLQQKLKMS